MKVVLTLSIVLVLVLFFLRHRELLGKNVSFYEIAYNNYGKYIGEVYELEEQCYIIYNKAYEEFILGKNFKQKVYKGFPVWSEEFITLSKGTKIRIMGFIIVYKTVIPIDAGSYPFISVEILNGKFKGKKVLLRNYPKEFFLENNKDSYHFEKKMLNGYYYSLKENKHNTSKELLSSCKIGFLKREGYIHWLADLEVISGDYPDTEHGKLLTPL